MTIVFVEVKNAKRQYEGHFENALRFQARRKLYAARQLPPPYCIDDYATVGHAGVGSWVRHLSPHIDDDKMLLFVTNAQQGYAKKFSEAISQLPGDSIFLFSLVTQGYELTREMICTVKEHKPSAKTVVGGVHATLKPEQTCRDLSPSLLVRGEADHTIKTIIKSLKEGTAPNVRGLYFINRRDGSVSNTGGEISKSPVEGIRTDWSFHLSHSPGVARFTPFYMTSRDCPFNCNFCSIVPTRMNRRLPSSAVAEDIRDLKEGLAKDGCLERPLYIIFEDPTFLAGHKHLGPLIDELSQLGVHWEVRTRISKPDSGTRSVYQAMANAGCRSAFFGIESFDQGVLGTTNKKIRSEWIRPYLDAVRESGMIVTAGFICGLPGQTRQIADSDLEKIISLMDSDVLSAPEYYFLNVYPGSEFFERPERYGIKIIPTRMDHIEHNIIHETNEMNREGIANVYDNACRVLSVKLKAQADHLLREGQGHDATS